MTVKLTCMEYVIVILHMLIAEEVAILFPVAVKHILLK